MAVRPRLERRRTAAWSAAGCRGSVSAGARSPGPETVLIEDWCQQYPSHSVGSLGFGPDGALYVSAGDGASFNNVDYGQYGGTLGGTPTPKNPCADPPADGMTPPTAEGGALRSQDLRTEGPTDPADPRRGGPTGRSGHRRGLPGNPYASSSDPNKRRVIAYGLRNPFRIRVPSWHGRAMGRGRRLVCPGGDQSDRRCQRRHGRELRLAVLRRARPLSRL